VGRIGAPKPFAAGYDRLARVAKLADAAPLKGAIPMGCAGSSPAPGTFWRDPSEVDHYTDLCHI
jgi:hypothetical protein